MMTRMFRRRPRWRVEMVLLGLFFSAWSWAHETDNFFLPLTPDFADLGDFLEVVHTRAIERGVEEVNSRIERAIKRKTPERQADELARWQTAGAVAEAVAGQFGGAVVEVPHIEHALRGSWVRRNFPGRTVTHRDIAMNLRGRLPIDPRAVGMLFQSSTLKACGVYFGTDKLLHFHKLGYAYFKHYQRLRKGGTDDETARREVIRRFAEGGVLAEGRLFGTLGTGIYSNGDMAANYAGFAFFRNLTEPIVFLGQAREPLVVRCGAFWRVNDQVRPGSGWFCGFVSNHWNEALNPSHYDWSMRPRVRRILERRAAPIVQFYTVKEGLPNDPAYFERLAQTLATLAGEPYGHSGQFDQLLNIGNTCIPALQARGLQP
jgi:hypothetical protein